MMDNSTSLDTRDENLAFWEIIVLVINLIITLIGNCFIFFALYLRRYHRRQRKLTRMYFFMMHLSIADFITGIFNILPQLSWDITFRYSISVFLLPFIVLLYTYAKICLDIRKNTEISHRFDHVNDMKRMNLNHKNRQPLISRAKIKTIKQMITVVSLYIITSSPFIGCQLWATWDPQAANSPFINGPIFTILTLMSSLTSCVNPWIYLWFNRELRIILLSYLKKIICNQNMISYGKDNFY
ncbi:hypothetical protein G9C98_004223 [Cotesia typhae]|uniref:G-protein coupled receptors family 1 profile domain-containing protein n=1 Tax=Cotesia typhae TaxID=2053667 RepID=A0A8J5UY64_9HYME|nr:hypothetical protein G9C98_004223 [Cotesia typhae]